MAGAYSFKVPAIAGSLPPGKVAELRVAGSSAITVSLTGQSGQFTGTNTIGAVGLFRPPCVVYDHAANELCLQRGWQSPWKSSVTLVSGEPYPKSGQRQGDAAPP